MQIARSAFGTRVQYLNSTLVIFSQSNFQKEPIGQSNKMSQELLLITSLRRCGVNADRYCTLQLPDLLSAAQAAAHLTNRWYNRSYQPVTITCETKFRRVVGQYLIDIGDYLWQNNSGVLVCLHKRVRDIQLLGPELYLILTRQNCLKLLSPARGKFQSLKWKTDKVRDFYVAAPYVICRGYDDSLFYLDFTQWSYWIAPSSADQAPTYHGLREIERMIDQLHGSCIYRLRSKLFLGPEGLIRSGVKDFRVLIDPATGQLEFLLLEEGGDVIYYNPHKGFPFLASLLGKQIVSLSASQKQFELRCEAVSCTGELFTLRRSVMSSDPSYHWERVSGITARAVYPLDDLLLVL